VGWACWFCSRSAVASPVSAEPPSSPTKPSPAWVLQLWRGINVVFPLLLGAFMLLAAWPGDQLGPRLRSRHDQLIEWMRPLSLSQSWSMYAPDPARGHYYMELVAYDTDGTRRVLEESELAETGWGTTFFWDRTRREIWRLTITGRVDEVNRNRTWYLRGVCVREARKGHDVQRLEMTQVFRRIRTPEQVREGQALLGPPKRRKAQDASCRVQIIREMIEADARRRGQLDD
jgi:hypothetical protein